MGGGGRLNEYVALGYYLDTTEKPSLEAPVLVKGSKPHWMAVDTPPRPLPVENDNVFMFVWGDTTLELVGTVLIETEFDFDPITGTGDDMRWALQLDRAK